MSELSGKLYKLNEEHKALKEQVYESLMSIITLSETGLAKAETNNDKELAALFRNIQSRALMLKGYSS